MKVTIEGLPPSVNSYLGRGRNGSMFRTAETTNWLLYASALIKKEIKFKFSNAVQVFIKVNYSNTKRDLDNMNKLILDAIKYSGIIKDDSMKYVEKICISAGRKVEKGHERLYLTIK